MIKLSFIQILCIFCIVIESEKVETSIVKNILPSITTDKRATLRSLNESINYILYSIKNHSQIYSTETLELLSTILKNLLDAKREIQYEIASSYFSLRGG